MVTATQNTGSAAALFSSLNATSSGAGKAAAAGGTTAAAQDRFLTLLVTQMKNQDPLNPMDNAQVTSQMAQLSTVSGITQLNTTLQALSGSLTTSQSLQAAAMIGHGILSPGNALTLANGSAVGGVNLSQSASSVQVAVQDQAGNTVRTMQLGALPAGVQGFQWDGLTNVGTAAPSGAYTFTVAATQGSGNVTSSALTYGLVNGVTPGTAGANLNVGVSGVVAMSQVQQIL